MRARGEFVGDGTIRFHRVAAGEHRTAQDNSIRTGVCRKESNGKAARQGPRGRFRRMKACYRGQSNTIVACVEHDHGPGEGGSELSVEDPFRVREMGVAVLGCAPRSAASPPVQPTRTRIDQRRSCTHRCATVNSCQPRRLRAVQERCRLWRGTSHALRLPRLIVCLSDIPSPGRVARLKRCVSNAWACAFQTSQAPHVWHVSSVA